MAGAASATRPGWDHPALIAPAAPRFTLIHRSGGVGEGKGIRVEQEEDQDQNPIAEIRGGGVAHWEWLQLIKKNKIKPVRGGQSRSGALTGVEFRTIDSSHHWVQLPAWPEEEEEEGGGEEEGRGGSAGAGKTWCRSEAGTHRLCRG